MAEDTEAVAKQVVNVPIVKAKTTMAITIDDIPADVWAEVILQGLKVIYNRGTSKITAAAFKGDKDALAKAALEKAQEQHDLVMASKIKFSGSSKKKAGVAGKVMTKARQFAKDLVKTELRKAGYKVSHIEASEITRLANLYLDSENGPAMIAKAQAFLEEQDALAAGEAPSFLKSVQISDKLVAADAAKKSKGGTLSAKQAGKVAKRAKGEAQATAH